MNTEAAPGALGSNEGLGGLSTAARDVLAERARQIEAEGWTPKHDDQHSNGSLALAAACYACNAATWAARCKSIPDADYKAFANPGFRWPWLAKWWKPKGQRRDLVRAAALLIAEIERLDRLPPNHQMTGAPRPVDQALGNDNT